MQNGCDDEENNDDPAERAAELVRLVDIRLVDRARHELQTNEDGQHLPPLASRQTHLDRRLGKHERLPREQTSRDTPAQPRRLANRRIGFTLSPLLDNPLDALPQPRMPSPHAHPRSLRPIHQPLSTSTPPSATQHPLDISIPLRVTSLVLHPPHADLMHNRAHPKAPRRRHLQTRKVRDPISSPPDLLEEGEREVRLLVERVVVRSRVAEEDDADYA